jgi:hypothetical protein
MPEVEQADYPAAFLAEVVRARQLIAALDRLDADADMLGRYQDGITNIAFVGRPVPIWKAGLDLLQAFAHYHHFRNPTSRLDVVLTEGADADEAEQLRDLIGELELRTACTVWARLTLAELKAVYLTTHALLCTAATPNILVPLVLAMRYQIPIVAGATPPVRWLLGDEALTWPAFGPVLLAQGLHHCLQESDIAEQVRACQRRRYQALMTRANGGRQPPGTGWRRCPPAVPGG